MTVRTSFALHDTQAQGGKWNPGSVDRHMPGACQAPTTTSLDLELAVALPSTGVWAAVGPSWLPPQWPPQGHPGVGRVLSQISGRCSFFTHHTAA